jgi:hypothetical protein
MIERVGLIRFSLRPSRPFLACFAVKSFKAFARKERKEVPQRSQRAPVFSQQISDQQLAIFP